MTQLPAPFKLLLNCAGLLLITLLLAGCNMPLRSRNPHRLPEDLVNGTYYHASHYPAGPPGTDSLSVQYLGCGGLYVRRNRQAFLVDPFFSYIKILPGLKVRLRRLVWLSFVARREVKIKPHSASVALGYKQIRQQPGYVQPQAVLITHGHYDHLLDIPSLYRHHFTDGPPPLLYGNTTTLSLLQEMDEVVPRPLLRDMEKSMAVQQHPGTWHTIGDPARGEHIRFMAIEADHAPHVKSLKLFDGDALSPVGDYSAYEKGTSINKWREGRTLGLLVDFMHGWDSIAYRMFILTSACAPTRGLIPEALKAEKSVDLAVLCVASYSLVGQYPDSLLSYLEPKEVMLVHWEDFLFRSYQRTLKKPKTIGFTNVKSFITRMQEIRSRYHLTCHYTLPAPGVRATYRFKGIPAHAGHLK